MRVMPGRSSRSVRAARHGALVILSAVSTACDFGTVVVLDPLVVGAIGGEVTVTGVGGQPGVSVLVSGTEVDTTVTDASGNFSFPRLAGGTYFVVIEDYPAGLTFGSTQERVEITENGPPPYLTFEGAYPPVVLEPQMHCTDVPPASIATFDDTNLESAVRGALGLAAQDTLTCALAATLTDLDASSLGITSAWGAQNLTGLDTLWMGSNEIPSAQPFRTLTNIELIDLEANLITDIGPLAEISARSVGVGNNPISDLSQFIDLVGVEELQANDLGITDSDLAVFAGLTDLTWLNVADNLITDPSALAPLTGLERLQLLTNSINDVSGLASLTGLADLDLRSNQIADLGPLSDLTSLASMDLGDNPLSDISVLQNLTGLDRLHLEDNASLSNIQPLIDNTGIGAGDEIWLEGTPVSCTDVNTLRGKGVTVHTSACP